MSLKNLNMPTKGALDWDVPMNENMQSITDYAVEVDTRLSKLDEKAAATHSHGIGDVSGLQTALDGKSASNHTHTAQTSVTGNAGTATKQATARTIDGVSYDASANITHYGVCSTVAATAAKTVALTSFVLGTGARITVKFTTGNTAAAPTLNINSTGAKDMLYRGVKITAAAPTLQTNGVYDFVYNGTEYELIGNISVGYGY